MRRVFYALAFAVMIASVGILGSASTSALEEPANHERPAGDFSAVAPLDTACVPDATDLQVGSSFDVTIQEQTMRLDVDAVQGSPMMELVRETEDGLVHELVDTDMRFLEGTLGEGDGRFFLTVTNLGLDGQILDPSGRTFDLAPAGMDEHGWCSDVSEASFVFGLLGDDESGANGPSAMATSTVDVLIGIDSAMYNKYPLSYSSVAFNIFNRAKNIYSSNFGQSLDVYLFLVSTSSSTDTSLGMTGSTSSNTLSNWGTYANSRTDKSSWDMASLQKSSAPLGGDGIAYLAGRYNVNWIENSGHSSGSSNFYQYNGVLVSHEMGHNFEAQHSANAYYWTYQQTCHGYVYYDPVDNHRCIGYSSNCNGVVITAITDSQGRPYCIGSSPPVQDEKHYYVMAAFGYHDPANDVYWDGIFESVSKSQVNACLPTWHSLSYSPGNRAC